MKKTGCLILTFALLCMAFVACGELQLQSEPPLDDNADLLLEETKTKLTYYEELVVVMQQQLMDLKSALYSSRAEYDALYALYRASDKGENSGQSAVPETYDSYRYIKENGGITITSYHGKSKTVIIPSQIDGLAVKAIGDRAFSQNTEITSVKIPDGVERIGWFAFSGCVSLVQITVPDSVSEIAYGVFELCDAAMTVYCPQSSYAAAYAESYGIKTRH